MPVTVKEPSGCHRSLIAPRCRRGGKPSPKSQRSDLRFIRSMSWVHLISSVSSHTEHRHLRVCVEDQKNVLRGWLTDSWEKDRPANPKRLQQSTIKARNVEFSYA